MSRPLHIYTYENNDVRLDIQEFETHRVIWLQCGAAAISFNEEQIRDAHELLDAYVTEDTEVSQTLRLVSAFVLGIIVVFIIAALLV